MLLRYLVEVKLIYLEIIVLLNNNTADLVRKNLLSVYELLMLFVNYFILLCESLRETFSCVMHLTITFQLPYFHRMTVA